MGRQSSAHNLVRPVHSLALTQQAIRRPPSSMRSAKPSAVRWLLIAVGLLLFHSVRADDLADKNTVEELACAKSFKSHRWLLFGALGVQLLFAFIFLLVACLVCLWVKKLEHGTSQADRAVFGVMDDVLTRCIPAPLTSEMVWRAGCVQLRHNAKHERRMNRALALSAHRQQQATA
ncbi:hypothetical protein M3Y99_00049500 [Aphelenchoides fujianensis]|nr:hypothetical protein M3Y99_00049500 [Aphelenchoides fujianensis]